MRKIISILVSLLTLSQTVSAQTIDNIEFFPYSGGFTVSGKASGENLSFQVLERYTDGHEEDRLEYVALGKSVNGEYSHDVKLKNPNGMYVLKVSDGHGEPTEKVMYLSSSLSSDGISTEMPETVNIGDKIDAEVNRLKAQ